MGNGVSNARDPFFATDVSGSEATLVWSDDRDGDGDIYRRQRGLTDTWGSEGVALDNDLDCRHPSFASAYVLDMPVTETLLICEAIGTGGAQEVNGYLYQCGQEFWLSPDDGVPSVSSGVRGFTFQVDSCGNLETGTSLFVPAWIDEGQGTRVGRFENCGIGALDTLESWVRSATIHIDVNAFPEFPNGVLQLWTEEEGAPSSFGREPVRSSTATAKRCLPETPVLIGPQGEPSTRVRFFDECSDMGIEGATVDLFLDSVDGDLTWDSTQPHPHVAEATDPDGYATFSIRGGGCAVGPVYAGDLGNESCEVHLARRQVSGRGRRLRSDGVGS
ncbi:MAG: hypothetical protein R3E97_19275 [Candidatus Eisenbacteria bacterium]